MTNFMIPFKYKALQIWDESFLIYFDRLSRLPNFNNLMIFIMKTKNGVCQCVSPMGVSGAVFLYYSTLAINIANAMVPL